MTSILMIDLNPREQVCGRCGKITALGYGLPVDESGLIVPNWFEGEWAGIPACRECYEVHEKWSKELKKG